MNTKNMFKRIIRITLSGLLGLLFFILLDVAMWFFPPERGWAPWQWESSGPIAVSNNKSIELLTRTAHPFLAEYDQRLLVYAGTSREGKRTGAIDLHMNTGGRTHVIIYFDQAPNGNIVLLKDRFGFHKVDLGSLKIEDRLDTENLANYRFIGTISKEAYPLKFVSPSVWSDVEALKKIKE